MTDAADDAGVGQTVYVNDNPIGSDSEVYHAKQWHATRRRWTSDFTRETTAKDAREEGLRPCKQCFPSDGNHCPACGYPAEDKVAPGTVRCRNGDCRVAAFEEEVADER